MRLRIEVALRYPGDGHSTAVLEDLLRDAERLEGAAVDLLHVFRLMADGQRKPVARSTSPSSPPERRPVIGMIRSVVERIR